MNPRIINLHIKAHNEWIIEQDYLAWLSGKYVHDAIMVGLSKLSSKNSDAEYPKAPYLYKATEDNANDDSKDELTKSAENFMLRLQIMGLNYERANKNKDSTVS